MQYTIHDLCDADKRATDADLKDATEAVTLEDAIILFEAKKRLFESLHAKNIYLDFSKERENCQ